MFLTSSPVQSLVLSSTSIHGDMREKCAYTILVSVFERWSEGEHVVEWQFQFSSHSLFDIWSLYEIPSSLL